MSKMDKQSGFSLLEMIIAMFLLMVGFLAVITVLWSSAQSGSFSRDMTTAANLNQDIMERLTSFSYDSLPVSADFVDYTNANPMAAGFTRQTKVEENAAANLKTITVKISWNEKGRIKTRLYTMMKSKFY
ncbi:pilus assembly protein PilV [bacterium]|nr:pilus assembly protein PilV [bacterium]